MSERLGGYVISGKVLYLIFMNFCNMCPSMSWSKSGRYPMLVAFNLTEHAFLSTGSSRFVSPLKIFWNQHRTVQSQVDSSPTCSVDISHCLRGIMRKFELIQIKCKRCLRDIMRHYKKAWTRTKNVNAVWEALWGIMRKLKLTENVNATLLFSSSNSSS